MNEAETVDLVLACQIGATSHGLEMSVCGNSITLSELGSLNGSVAQFHTIQEVSVFLFGLSVGKELNKEKVKSNNKQTK